MLLNSVAVGKAYETYHNKPTLRMVAIRYVRRISRAVS